jgi:hypothetical protein
MPDIFISYRTRDTLHEAVTLNETLSRIFGQDVVFFDKNRLECGTKWPETVEKSLLEAKVVLVLFSNAIEWLGVNELGDRRIDEEEDWVRKEVALALAQNKTVMPLLFGDNVSLPPKKKLPPDIQELCDCHTKTLRMTHWKDDTEPLMTSLMEIGIRAINSNESDIIHNLGWNIFFNRFTTYSVGEIIRVNCDRQESYENGILDHFLINESKNKNQVYFIPACTTQNPDSLAKRLIFELKDNDKNIAFLKNQFEIIFLKFEVKLNKHTTFTSLWKQIQKCLVTDADSPAQLANDSLLRDKSFIILTFKVTEKQWDKTYILDHLSYFLSRFSPNENCPKKYIILFVFEFKNLHKLTEFEVNNKINPIKDLANEISDFNLHLCSILKPVGEDEVKTWFTDVVSDANSDAVDELISILKENHPANCVQDGFFNMEIVEEMQLAAYRHFVGSQS